MSAPSTNTLNPVNNAYIGSLDIRNGSKAHMLEKELLKIKGVLITKFEKATRETDPQFTFLFKDAEFDVSIHKGEYSVNFIKADETFVFKTCKDASEIEAFISSKVK